MTGLSADDFGIPVTGNERHKGFVRYVPRPGSDREKYMDTAEAVVRRYLSQGTRVGPRAVAYRTASLLGVGHDQLDNIEDAILMLRRTMRIGMYHLSDGRTDWTTYWTVSTAEAAQTLYDTIEDLRSDRQDGQPYRAVLMLEAAGLVPILAPVAEEYGVPIMSGSGSVPITASHTIAAKAVRHHQKTDISTVVLCVTDFDLKGIKGIFVPFARDVAAFASRTDAVQVLRIAATPQQITAHVAPNLLQEPPAEPWWPADFSLPAAEALVDFLPDYVRAEFDHYLPDRAARAAQIESEAELRRHAAMELRALLDEDGAQ